MIQRYLIKYFKHYLSLYLNFFLYFQSFFYQFYQNFIFLTGSLRFIIEYYHNFKLFIVFKYEKFNSVYHKLFFINFYL